MYCTSFNPKVPKMPNCMESNYRSIPYAQVSPSLQSIYRECHEVRVTTVNSGRPLVNAAQCTHIVWGTQFGEEEESTVAGVRTASGGRPGERDRERERESEKKKSPPQQQTVWGEPPPLPWPWPGLVWSGLGASGIVS